MPTKRLFFYLSLCLFLSLSLASCGHLGVKPWERDLMAKPEMQLINDPAIHAVDEQIYVSKEATSGGSSTGGGGCGGN